jgi:DNA-binding LacI/PurR family transcriptional regulator
MLTGTIKLVDVAKAAGVSQGTASNVFNRPELVRPEVRERVEAAAKQLGYEGPDPKGRLLRAGKVNAIGVVVHERLRVFLEDPHDLTMLTGIAEVCDARGSGMAMISAYREDEAPAWSIKSAIVDGFIVFCLEEGDRLLEEVRRRKLPFVAIDQDPGPNASSVRIDDRGGARMAAEHLVRLGHRRFGILALELSGDWHYGPVTPERRRSARYESTRRRLDGYSESLAAAGPENLRNQLDGYAEPLAAAGIDIDAVPIMEVLHTRKNAAEATAELLARWPDTTAILAMSDLLALGVLDYAEASGIAVPERLSVIGFDDIPGAATAHPPLTTIAQPIRDKGRLAAKLIFENGPPRTEVLDVKLVVRDSTGPAPR